VPSAQLSSCGIAILHSFTNTLSLLSGRDPFIISLRITSSDRSIFITENRDLLGIKLMISATFGLDDRGTDHSWILLMLVIAERCVARDDVYEGLRVYV
jgi:hypothetical protein